MNFQCELTLFNLCDAEQVSACRGKSSFDLASICVLTNFFFRDFLFLNNCLMTEFGSITIIDIYILSSNRTTSMQATILSHMILQITSARWLLTTIQKHLI